MITRYEVQVVTSAAGAATVYTPPVSGLLHAIAYAPPSANKIDTNGDVTITAEASGAAILTITNLGTAAFTVCPRAATVTVVKETAALYAAGGTAVNDRIPLGAERVKIVVADGGNTMSGTFHIYVEE